jgi:hypothetical protein
MGAKTRKLSQINDSLIEWQSVVTASTLTAVAGRGYFIDTTSNACTVTFPASPKIGDTIIINDYASTFATNNVTINLNGNKLEASTDNGLLSTNDQTHTFVFTDTTQGWKIVNQDTGTNIQPTYISATGGTVTTSGNFKIHSFTGDGSFVVSSVGNPLGSISVDYLVIAGGGGGGKSTASGGGAGAGGVRFSATTYCSSSPLKAATSFPVSATTYPITVGAGGSGATPSSSPAPGTSGSPSVFSTITSTGGGFGGGGNEPAGIAARSGGPGGSGGGGAYGPGPTSPATNGGSGNTPPVSPPQGNNGAVGGPQAGAHSGGGGGGFTSAGSVGSPTVSGGPGGNGLAISITGSSVERGGGGGGGSQCSSKPGGAGGLGGGGPGGTDGPGSSGTAGTANTGGGGGGSGPGSGGAGGKGIVIIRYRFQ